IQVGTDAGQTIGFSVAGIDTGALGLSSSTTLTDTGNTVSNASYRNPTDFGPGEDYWFVDTTIVEDWSVAGGTMLQLNDGDMVAFGSDTNVYYEVSVADAGDSSVGQMSADQAHIHL
mgnify:CR=1